MSIFDSIVRYAVDYRARRRRMANYLEISALPIEIRKDIGWAEIEATPRARTRR